MTAVSKENNPRIEGPTMGQPKSLRQMQEEAHDRGICLDGCPVCAENVEREKKPLADTLMERGKQYGDYTAMAEVAQAIKLAMYTGENWHKLAAHERESLDLIATKIARIVSGGPGQLDSWHDIGGYAKLSEVRCPAGWPAPGDDPGT